jgi:hypothetical protein
MTAPVTSSATDAAEIKALLGELAALVKPFNDLLKIKPSDATALTQLDRACGKLPAPQNLGVDTGTLVERLVATLERIRSARVAEFGRWEAELIQTSKQQGVSIREGERSWRLDALELKLDREQLRARVLYNQEEVLPWTPIDGVRALEELLTRGRRELERVTLDDSLLIDVFWRAFDALCARQARAGRLKPELVPLPDFQREVRVELVRMELTGGPGAPARRITRTDMPQWAFLHNLDRYRRLGGTVPSERRLALQTGGQAESREYAMVVNGLDAQGALHIPVKAAS